MQNFILLQLHRSNAYVLTQRYTRNTR